MKFRILILLGFAFLISACRDDKKKKDSTPPPVVQQMIYTVKGKLPHDAKAFTEGLFFHQGKLYEGTGSPNDMPETKTQIGIIDTATGKMDVKAELDRNQFFGEGVVILNDKLYQLTYKNQTCFIYDAKTFKQLGTYKYTNAEGWGMTTDGKSLIISDGTDKITYWNPADMSTEKTISVKANGQPQIYINELEYVNGHIYANVWTTNQIVKIDPNSGHIVGVFDVTNLFNEAKSVNPKLSETNGIAYNPDSKLLYITGKMWPTIYKLEVAGL
jgi:glutaminyl-peptide cyclotransferase